MKYTHLAGQPLAHRHLVIVDAENVGGCAVPSATHAASSHTALIQAIPDLEASFVVVACNHLAAPAVSWEWKRARKLWRSGPNGADLALLEVLQTEDIAGRFDRVTVCSGDGIFAETVAMLAALGITTTVVGLAGHISARLRLAATITIELSTPDAPDTMAAA
jgi:hypothetical protein